MNTVEEFLPYLSGLNIKLWLEGDELKVSAPKGVFNPELVRRIQTQKTAIIAFLKSRDRTAPEIVPIRQVPRDEPIPLSFPQIRLWALDQLEGLNTDTYLIAKAVELVGPLQIDNLRRAIQTIFERHESLRTYFSSHDGQPRQMIAASPALPFRVIDLVTHDDPEIRARKLIEEEMRQGFSLDRPCLARLMVLCLESDRNVLFLNMHHIISDAWSSTVMIRELMSLYQAYVADEPSSLAALPVQYAEFAQWQLDELSRGTYEHHAAFWREELAGMPSLLSLPSDRPRPAIQSFAGKSLDFTIDPALTKQLRDLAGSQQVTLFMLLETIFAVLLSKYSGSDDIPVGTPIANRTRPEFEGLIGFFVNTLVLRNQLGGNPEFLAMLARTKRTALNAFAHQALPFEKVVEQLNPVRDPSFPPLFQVVFALQNVPSESLNLPELHLNPFHLNEASAKFDMTVFLNENGDHLEGVLEYSSSLFDHWRMQRLITHFSLLMAQVVADPTQRLGDLTLLTAQERTRLQTWNQTDRPLPEPASIHQVFESWVQRTPSAPALSWLEGDPSLRRGSMSYAALDEYASQLAIWLQSKDVGPEDAVAFCLERTPTMVAVLLAILKCGATYVPLERDYPHSRIRLMLEDCGAKLFLVDSQSLLSENTLPDLTHVVNISEALTACKALTHSSFKPMPCFDSSLGAYLMYTSGSTGKPKGVAVNHQNVVRLVSGSDYVDFANQPTTLSLAPLAFDASTFEIWGALLNGGCCALYDETTITPTRLGMTLERLNVEVMWLTASLFNVIMDEAPETLTHVHHILVGGEALNPVFIRKARALLPHVRLTNGYGPTEGTTFTCCYAITETADEVPDALPIGGAIANTQVFVLDEYLHQVPIGNPGELFIGGLGLAQGYFRRPALTALRFMPNPFTGEGSRMYRSGDWVSLRQTGILDFMGRRDDQVKLRGFRVEPAEIEHVLLAHPDINKACVLKQENRAGIMQLVAFVEPESNRQDSVDPPS